MMKIKSVNYLRGEINLPGDKSISHRAAMFSALAEGTAKIENFASSADCASTLSCLEKMGVEIKRNGETVFIKGVGKRGFNTPVESLDCGNSGSTMRMLAGILAGQNFSSTMIGDESLSKRPMKRIIEPLRLMNAEITAENFRSPLYINGKNPLKSINYISKVASAQVKSCVIIAGLFADGKTTIRNPKSKLPVPNSRNHTELMLKYLGADLKENFVEEDGEFIHEIEICGKSALTAKDLTIPSDISSAAFFIIAAASLPNSDITLKNVGLNPTRTGIIEVLQNLGANIEILNKRELCNEVVGDLRVRGLKNTNLRPETNIIKGDIISNIIDEIPILAVFGTCLEGGLEIREAEELRVKESDRIKSTVDNLKRMGASVKEFHDGLRVEKSNLKGAKIETYHDHRIAMAFAIAGLFAEGETEILGAEWANVSFPSFFETLKKLSVTNATE